MNRSLKVILLVSLLSLAILILGACKEKNNNVTQNDNTPTDQNDHVHCFTLENPSDNFIKSVATCQSKAVYYKSCECGACGTETFVFGELGSHTFDRQVTDEKYFKSPATCYSADSYYMSCACGEKGTDEFYVGNTIAHTYNGGYFCEVCHHERSSDGLIFEYSELHNLWTVVGYDENLPEDVHIASTHNGSPVVAVGTEAFKNCAKIKSVYLSDGVSISVGEAFKGCINLESVRLGSSVSSHIAYAFEGCDNLREISMLQNDDECFIEGNCIISKEYIEYENGENEYVYVLVLGCQSSVIPQDKDIKIIAEKAFAGRNGLTDVTIPDSVREIGRYAFEGCSDLKTLTIGTGLELVGDSVFAHCTALEAIYYGAINMDCSGTTIFADAGRDGSGITLTIGNSVETIPDSLFAGEGFGSDEFIATKLKSLVFESGSSLKSIGAYAFYSAGMLSTLELPKSVTEIKQHAFARCAGLTEIKLDLTNATVEEFAFSECTSLNKVIISKDVKVIGNSVFYGCAENLAVYCEASERPEGYIYGTDERWDIGVKTVYWYSELMPDAPGNYWHYINGQISYFWPE